MFTEPNLPQTLADEAPADLQLGQILGQRVSPDVDHAPVALATGLEAQQATAFGGT
jgi:hypothetical protein